MIEPRDRRRVLVTGASRGIGRAVAQAFAAQGDIVAVHYMSQRDEAQSTLSLLEGEGHIVVQADLRARQGAMSIVEECIGQLDGIDVLINHAGVAPSPSNSHPVLGTSFDHWAERWSDMISVNLLGAAHVTWAFAAQYRGDSGAVVNVGSRGALRGEPDHPAYAASKAALHAFGQSIAATLAPLGVSVASLAPGVVATERQTAMLSSPAGADVREQSPFGRVATPQEVAHAVVHLASPESVWASGAVLDFNGASYLRP